MDFLFQTWSVVLLVLGFGFVVFFHELGHFLAAKYVGIKVEQFAVGFGQAVLSWRKGLGVTWGSSGKKMEALEKQEREGLQKIDLSRYGDTEYRINWIPLGGYVKMLGQDDLKPGVTVEDPRSYNKKSISARMLVVSAGVIMNVILAAIGFMIVFLIGFKVPPAVVGSVFPGSAAQKTVRQDDGQPAPLQVGDRIRYFDGKYQHDFTKISLNVALVEEGASVPLYVERAGTGKGEHLLITPERRSEDAKGFLSLGIIQPMELRGLDDKQALSPALLSPELQPDDVRLIKPGDVITKIGDEDVKVNEYYKLDRALQQGRPVQVTVTNAGQTRQVTVQPHFLEPFGKEMLNIAGLLPRPMVQSLLEGSKIRGQLKPGDVIVSITSGSDRMDHPTQKSLLDRILKAGEEGRTVDLTVVRDGKELPLKGLNPAVRIEKGRGLGIALAVDEQNPLVAGTVSGSPTSAIPAGSTITSIDAKPVRNWFDVQTYLASAQADRPVAIAVRTADGEVKTFETRLSADQLADVRSNRYGQWLLLHEQIENRQTDNPFVAAAWGVTETRDFILQFYLTLQRMFQGSVSYKNMMGPVGIVTAGAHFAFKGTDWLIWFLAMISANLAVVNFLPIPIVDGGLFTFLILEKIQGKPLSQRTQSIAQVVGLALILSVFLLVTYQDILRLVH